MERPQRFSVCTKWEMYYMGSVPKANLIFKGKMQEDSNTIQQAVSTSSSHMKRPHKLAVKPSHDKNILLACGKDLTIVQLVTER